MDIKLTKNGRINERLEKRNAVSSAGSYAELGLETAK